MRCTAQPSLRRFALLMKLAAARTFALSLPEAAEMPHFVMTSFRVRGKIFATATPDEQFLHVFVSEAERKAAVKAESGCCADLHWGKNIVGVRVTLARAKAGMVKEMLRSAWLLKAPKSLRGE
jgi:hypothetical protein